MPVSSFHRVCSTEVLVSGEYVPLFFDFVVHVHVPLAARFLGLTLCLPLTRNKGAACDLKVSVSVERQLCCSVVNSNLKSFLICCQCKVRNPDSRRSCAE